MLAHRYREQWKFIRAIRIITDAASRYQISSALNWFVNCLMIFRNKLLLDVAESSIPLKSLMASKRQRYTYNHESHNCYSILPSSKVFVFNNHKYLHWFLPKGLITSSTE
jgi:hypothetical protein